MKDINLSTIFEKHGKNYCNHANPDAEFIYASDLGVSYNDMSLHSNRFHRWTAEEVNKIMDEMHDFAKKGISIVDDMPKYKAEYFGKR